MSVYGKSVKSGAGSWPFLGTMPSQFLAPCGNRINLDGITPVDGKVIIKAGQMLGRTAAQELADAPYEIATAAHDKFYISVESKDALFDNSFGVLEAGHPSVILVVDELPKRPDGTDYPQAVKDKVFSKFSVRATRLKP